MIHLNKNSSTSAWKKDLEILSQNSTKTPHLNMHVQRLKEEVAVEILHWVKYIRCSFSYLWKLTTINSAFQSENRPWFNLPESGVRFTFQFALLYPFQTKFFFYTPLSGPFTNYVRLKLLFFQLHSLLCTTL